MLYDYQYTVIACITSILLLILISLRRSYATIKNRIYLEIIILNILTSASDIFTYWTISFPRQFSPWVLYLSNMIYLIFFVATAVTFMLYVIAMLEDVRMLRAARVVYGLVMAVSAALILSTPWTKWIIFYDDQFIYRHGNLFYLLYLFPMVLDACSIGLLLFHRQHYSRYQMLTVVTMFAFALSMAAFQWNYPKIDLFQLICSTILCVVYISFENPAYDTFHTTNCFNSKAFYERCLDAESRKENPKLILIGFVNRPQNHGIEAVNELIGLMDKIAEMLRKKYGQEVYCIADNKFILLLKDTADETETKIMDGLKKMFSSPVCFRNHQTKVELMTRSIYFSELKISDDFIDHLIETIQQTSVEQLFSSRLLPELLTEQHEYRLIEDIVMQAIQNKSFRLVYQPIFDLKSKQFHSAEALLRLSDSELGWISPETFIPIAEKNDSILEIGEMVLDMVCRFLKTEPIQQLGLRYIELNVSTVQLLQLGMAERFIRILEQHQILASSINLEITETAELNSNQIYLENIRILKDFGFSFSIDDYGSGYASEDYLYRVPIQLVKIDKSMLWNAMKNPDARTVFEHSIRMMKELNKQVIVEGAEDTEMVELIRSLGGDYIQGYYYSKPLEPDEFVRFIQTHLNSAFLT